MATKNKHEVIALHWGSDGLEVVTDTKRARELYSGDTQMVWGADTNDKTVDVGGGDYRHKFHPGRDYQWGAMVSHARAEWRALQAAGVPLKSDLFRGEHGFDDLGLLFDLVDGQNKAMKAKGYDGHWLLDNAPSIYIAEETIRQTGEIVEEELVALSARSLLPSVNFNTYLESYRYDRIADKLNRIAMPANMAGATERTVPQSSEVTRTPVYKPLHWFDAGASWEWFELEYFAEARANGAPDLDIVNRKLRNARLQHELTYNNIAFFGWPALGLTGVLDSPDLASETVPAAGQLGAGTTEDDLAIFVDNFKAIIDNSVNIEKPDTIALGTSAWTYINTTIFKGLESDSTETLASVIMKQLAPLGLRDIVWVPEMEYRAAQESQWQNEFGFSASLAERWAGGIGGENVMLIFRKSAEAGRMVIGKDVAARPQETIQDRTTVRLVQSLGSFDVKRPKAFRIVTNIGPA